MESWSVGFDGDTDVERHAGMDSEPARPALRLRVVSDYICPWCYIGLKRVERLAGEYTIEFDTCAYELRPGIPPEGIAREKLAPGRTYPPGYLENLRETAREAGIDMKRPALVPNTIKAHEATEFAKEHGLLHQIHGALFRAYFEEERNIGDIDIITEIGSGVGLDADELRRALDEGRYTAAVREQLRWARAIGVTGVPTAVFNEKFAVVGAQEYLVYQDVASRVANGRLAGDDSARG